MNIDHQKISGATYTLRNDSGQPLIAYAIGIAFYWSNAPTKLCHGGVSEDSWFLHGEPLAPGAQEPGEFTTGITPQSEVSLLRVEVTVDFAEFSNGSIAGTNAAALKIKFDAARRAKLSVQQRYANMLKTGNSAQSVSRQIETDAAKNMYRGEQRLALSVILMELKQLGSDGLAKQLLEQPTLPLSPQ